MLPQNLIRWGFFLLYHQLAFTYDAVAWAVSLGQWSRWRLAARQFLLPGDTLELAYGTGGLFTTMASGGAPWFGLDRSPFMARLTAQKLRRLGLPPGIIQAQAQTIPFPAGRFANVVATFPTEYIFETRTLAEIRRVLRPQGVLIVVLQGQLIGPPPLRAFIESLYRITGQRESSLEVVLARFARAGFAPRCQTAVADGAAATVLVAHKLD